jgi:preprotein translocase subunit SecE
VARNRKRAKERRNRRSPGPARSAPGLATARAQRESTPDPLDHATPDVELAEEQIAYGRQPADGDVTDEGLDGAELAEEQELNEEELYFEAERAEPAEGVYEDEEEEEPAERGRGGLATRASSTPEHHIRPSGRLINFLQGSWRELQRVQWPDRRAVMQATGVVIGFVIVAGIYLGLADQVAQKIVTLILK